MVRFCLPRLILIDSYKSGVLQEIRLEGHTNLNSDCFGKNEFRNMCGEAMMAIHVQSTEDNLYPNGFKVDQFAAVIEKGVIWEVLDL
jgi:hypothetical protein